MKMVTYLVRNHIYTLFTNGNYHYHFLLMISVTIIISPYHIVTSGITYLVKNSEINPQWEKDKHPRLLGTNLTEEVTIWLNGLSR